MSYFDALLYGAVQGLTEYLPISSSAHLILLPKFLGESDPGLAFDVFLHIGTLAATLAYFWRDWLAILSFNPKAPRYFPLQWIVLGTLPALAVGAALHHWIESAFRGIGIMAFTLSFFGLLLYGIDRKASQNRFLNSVSMRDALIVGFCQCLALIPGVSRSGSTITAGRYLGLERASAARFSFLLSAPVTAAAAVFELRKWHEVMSSSIGAGPLVVACLSSFVFGILAIGGLMKLVQRFSYLSFAVYRVALALVLVLLLK